MRPPAQLCLSAMLIFTSATLLLSVDGLPARTPPSTPRPTSFTTWSSSPSSSLSSSASANDSEKEEGLGGTGGGLHKGGFHRPKHGGVRPVENCTPKLCYFDGPSFMELYEPDLFVCCHYCYHVHDCKGYTYDMKNKSCKLHTAKYITMESHTELLCGVNPKGPPSV